MQIYWSKIWNNFASYRYIEFFANIININNDTIYFNKFMCEKIFCINFFFGIGFYEIFDFKLLIIILNFQK